MMVREQKFDVSEMALVTYLQAKAYGKPLTLMPATMMGRFQHGTMLYNSERGTVTPENLPGRSDRRALVRADDRLLAARHSVEGLRPRSRQGEMGDVRGRPRRRIRDPPGVERAADGKDMTKMVLDGELDAAIFGTVMPTDPRLKSVIPDPDAAAKDWYKKYGTVPVNHMVVVKSALSQSDPGAVREVFRMLHDSKKAAGLPKPGAIDTLPFGFDAVKPALDLMSSYALEMKIIPRRYSVEELFDDTTRGL